MEELSAKAKAKYMAMTEEEVLTMCICNGLAPSGSKDEMVVQLVDYEKPAGGWGMPVPAEGALSPPELLRTFKQANPQVWAIKDKQVCPSSCICAKTHPLTLTHLPCLRRRARRCSTG